MGGPPKKVAQNELKHILVVEFLRSDDFGGGGSLCEIQTTNQTDTRHSDQTSRSAHRDGATKKFSCWHSYRCIFVTGSVVHLPPCVQCITIATIGMNLGRGIWNQEGGFWNQNICFQSPRVGGGGGVNENTFGGGGRKRTFLKRFTGFAARSFVTKKKTNNF